MASDLCPVRDAHFVVGNGRDLAVLESEMFDYCFSYTVFQHIPDPEIVWNYLREIRRLLRPSGAFQVQFKQLRSVSERLMAPFPESLGRAASAMREAVAGIARRERPQLRLLPGSTRTWFTTPLEPGAVRSRLTALGFAAVDVIPDPTHPDAVSLWAIGRK